MRSDSTSPERAPAENHHGEICNAPREVTTLMRPGSRRRPPPTPQARKASGPKKTARPPADARDDPIAVRIDLGDLAGNLGYRLRRAQLWVFKDISRRLAPFALSAAQFSVLAVI